MGNLVRRRRQMILRKRFGQAWGDLFLANSVWPKGEFRVEGNGNLYISKLGLSIPLACDAGLALIQVEHHWDAFLKAGLRFFVEGKGLFVQAGKAKAKIDRLGDLAILHEVFVEGIYQFESVGPLVILDIGANIGLASLFFADRYQCPVYAYELVPSTAELARANFALNPHLTDLQLEAAGVGAGDRELELVFDPENSAGNSMFASSGSTPEKVLIREAGAVIRDVADKYPDRRIVVKLDAEGAEYGIARLWASSGMLAKIGVLMIEWHESSEGSVDELRDILRQGGFEWFERNHTEAPVGMIYAYRRD